MYLYLNTAWILEIYWNYTCVEVVLQLSGVSRTTLHGRWYCYFVTLALLLRIFSALLEIFFQNEISYPPYNGTYWTGSTTVDKITDIQSWEECGR